MMTVRKDYRFWKGGQSDIVGLDRLTSVRRSIKGLSLGGSVTLCKGGDAMCVTYSDLVQIGILIVALISLYQNRG